MATDPELPRRRLRSVAWALVAAQAEALACTGCVGATQLAKNAISAAKIGFTYAGSTTKGGAANNLACTGCVSVSEMKFDGDVNLGGNSIKAKNAVFSGDLSATIITATQFLGDGSKLSGIKIPTGDCKVAGQVVKGIKADGSLNCVAALSLSALPKDGLNEISNDLLSNQYIDEIFATTKNIPIPDNQGLSATSNIDFPDLGIAQTFEVIVHVENTDLSTLALTILPPDDKKIGWVLCDPCGVKDSKIYKQTFSLKNKPKSGDLGKWIGMNPKGLWNLKVADTNFCAPQIQGNTTYCDAIKKLDGWITDWSIRIQTLSSKKVEAKGLLITSGGLQLQRADSPPVACTSAQFGYMYASPKDSAIYVCNGSDFEIIPLNSLGSRGNPALDCLRIKDARPTAKSGHYWIDPDGVGGGLTSFETWCDQETNGGGWTLAIQGTMDEGYNNSLNKPIAARNGFMYSFNTVIFKDVMVKLGDYKMQNSWVVFAKVGTGSTSLDERIKNCCSGTYSVDYNVNIRHPSTARSKNLENVQEMESLSLRMSQTNGPNDAMFFVVGRKDRAACNSYNNNRTTNKSCIGVLLGFGSGNYKWSSWETRTDWKTTCTWAGYRTGVSSGSCSANGAVFVR